MDFEQAPLISVVIPNYNYGRFLAEAIDSVFNQTYPNIEVIVIDDGSTDNSMDVLSRYSGKIRCFWQENRGVSSARNRGIQESRGDYIAFLDSDDFWEAEKLSEQIKLFSEPSVGMVYSGLRHVSESGQILEERVSGLEGRVLCRLDLYKSPGVPVSGSTPLFRKECFKRVGLFDIALTTAADLDMTRRIASRYRIRMVRKPLASYRIHGAAMHLNMDAVENDVLLIISKISTASVAPRMLRFSRRACGKHYLMLSGAFLNAGRWGKSIMYAVRGTLTWPGGLCYILNYPVRRFRASTTRP